MPIQAIQRSGTSVEVVVGDALTREDVEFLRDALALGPRGADLTVDLRRTRTCELPALLALSRVLEESGARFALVGLTSASRRLLRYLDPGFASVDASRGPDAG